jgi:hypothetical protein
MAGGPPPQHQQQLQGDAGFRPVAFFPGAAAAPASQQQRYAEAPVNVIAAAAEAVAPYAGLAEGLSAEGPGSSASSAVGPVVETQSGYDASFSASVVQQEQQEQYSYLGADAEGKHWYGRYEVEAGADGSQQWRPVPLFEGAAPPLAVSQGQ